MVASRKVNGDGICFKKKKKRKRKEQENEREKLMVQIVGIEWERDEGIVWFLKTIIHQSLNFYHLSFYN